MKFEDVRQAFIEYESDMRRAAAIPGLMGQHKRFEAEKEKKAAEDHALIMLRNTLDLEIVELITFEENKTCSQKCDSAMPSTTVPKRSRKMGGV